MSVGYFVKNKTIFGVNEWIGLDGVRKKYKGKKKTEKVGGGGGLKRPSMGEYYDG